MKKLVLSLATCIFFLVCSNYASAGNYVYCTTKVKEIHPHKTSGIVYFKFQDGTAIQTSVNDTGSDKNLTIALAALMSDKNVKVALNEGQECGSNRYDNWSYIIAMSGN